MSNLTVAVDLPAGRLIDPSVEIHENATNVVGLATIGPLTDLLQIINLAALTNTYMYGTQQVAWLYVTAASNQPSAFLRVRLFDSIGSLPDGTLVTNLNEQIGRVVVVGQEPLLEGFISSNRQPALALYALVGTTNVVESSASLAEPVSWLQHEQITMTNLQRVLGPITLPQGQRFFRAWRP